MTEQLSSKAEVNSIEVVGHAEHLSDIAPDTLAHRGFLFLSELVLNATDLRNDILVVGGKASDTGKIGNRMLISAFLDEKTWRFVVEERQDEDDAGEHQVERGRDDPRVIGVLVDVETAAPGSEICKLFDISEYIDSEWQFSPLP